VVRGASEAVTLVVLEHPPAGRYRIVVAHGDSRVQRLRVMVGAAPVVHASLSGRGNVKRVTYRVSGGRASLLFVEKAGRDERVVGTGTGKGSLRFRVSPGRGRRELLAETLREGVPAVVIPVASFRPPRVVRLRAVRQLRVRRTQSGVVVAFRGVRGAHQYEVLFTLGDGRRELVRTRRTHVVLKGVYPEVGGVVAVRAAGDGVYTASGKYRRARIGVLLRPNRRPGRGRRAK